MATPAEPSKGSTSQPKKHNWRRKKPRKPQDQQVKNSSMEPSNITSVVADKHLPKQPKLADEDTFKGFSKDVTSDRTVMKSPGQPPKEFPTKSKKSTWNKKEKVTTPAGERVGHPPAMPSKTASLSSKTCNPNQAKPPEKEVEEATMKDPNVPTTIPRRKKSKKVKPADVFAGPSQEPPTPPLEKPASSSKRKKKSPEPTGGVPLVEGSDIIAVKRHNSKKPKPVGAIDEHQKPAVFPEKLKHKNYKKKESPGPTGGVPLVEILQIAPVECHSPQTANVVHPTVHPSHQGSSAGPSQNAQISASSLKGKKKLDEKPSAPAARAPAVECDQATLMKPRSPRKVTPINEDANSVLEESSTPALPTPQTSSSRTKRKKGNEQRLPQPASEIQSVEVPQTPSGPSGRAEIAKNLAQVFEAHQRAVIRSRSHKSGAKSKKFPFLRLPRELRDMIINYTIDYDGIDPMLVQTNETFPFTYIRTRKFDKKLQEWMTDLDGVHFRSVPTIFLLNQQIYEEAQEILRKKTLRISHPPQYPIKSIYDSSLVISDDALSKVSKIQFELHTYPATERRHDVLQNDWKGKSIYKDEYLADSYPWAMLLKDCFQVWRGTQDPRYLELSVDHCSGERSQYNLAVFGEKVRPRACLRVVMLAN